MTPNVSKWQQRSRGAGSECVVAGIHLSGPNARKSAVVLFEFKDNTVQFLSVYEKIGSSGTLFSDERILNILTIESADKAVFVDCPISEPPCVSCQRPVCPGVMRCDDVSVALMMAIDSKRTRAGARKLRPINPQNQRLWDVVQITNTDRVLSEPTYSANLAPLVVRAKTLLRRLKSIDRTYELHETNVPLLLNQIQERFAKKNWSLKYRDFGQGRKVRLEILQKLSSEAAGPLRIRINSEDLNGLSQSVEVFHALMTAAMGSWTLQGLAKSPTELFKSSEGWVNLLDLSLSDPNALALKS